MRGGIWQDKSGPGFVWYCVDTDEILITTFDMATVVMNYSPSINNPIPGVVDVQVTPNLKGGRLIHESGSQLEFIGEL